MKTVFQWVYAPQTQPSTRSADRAVADGATAGSLGKGISDRIEQAFDAASSSTGTSFDYLVKTAQRESSMDPSAKAKTSSAAGLFQFIESTWLETLKLSGAEFGLGQVADQIRSDGRGNYSVADPALRREILDLRHDPEIASMMAGALTRRNAGYLSERLGREPSGGELYMAHFLGARGAASLIELTQASPDATAADYFPRQAAANRGIFYENGAPRSLSAVYANLVSRHGGGAPVVDESPAELMTAYAGPLQPPGAADAAVPFPSPADRVSSGWRAVDPQGAFAGLFRTDGPVGAQPGAAAWGAFAMAPALFEVAAAEDAVANEVDERQRAEAAAANPSLVNPNRKPLWRGPLDLARFLDAGRG